MKAKHIITAVVVFASAIAGVAVGDLIVNRDSPAAVSSFTSLPSYRASLTAQGMDLSLESGDLFPLENCYNGQGQMSNFEAVIMGRPCMIIFSAPGCLQCSELYRVMNEYIDVEQTSFSLIACVSQSDREAWTADAVHESLPIETVYYDEATFREKYNLRIIPTILTTDRSGFVQQRQVGYVDGLDPEIIYFLRKMTS